MATEAKNKQLKVPVMAKSKPLSKVATSNNNHSNSMHQPEPRNKLVTSQHRCKSKPVTEANKSNRMPLHNSNNNQWATANNNNKRLVMANRRLQVIDKQHQQQQLKATSKPNNTELAAKSKPLVTSKPHQQQNKPVMVKPNKANMEANNKRLATDLIQEVPVHRDTVNQHKVVHKRLQLVTEEPRDQDLTELVLKPELELTHQAQAETAKLLMVQWNKVPNNIKQPRQALTQPCQLKTTRDQSY